jgi:probable rRNA maturation factor
MPSEPDSRALRVVVSDEAGRAVRVGALARWLERTAPARARGHISVALVSDARSRALNRRYRRVDRPTDVLSFPAFALSTARASARRAPDHFLGDIVIARGVAKRQAREVGHPELAELKVLALHGLLHLIGYDHETDSGQMRRLEQRLLQQAGISKGLILRHPVLDACEHRGATVRQAQGRPEQRRRSKAPRTGVGFGARKS